MSGPINGVARSYDETRYANAFNEIQVDSSRVWGSAIYEAFLDNPEASIFRLSELDMARGKTPKIARAVAGVAGASFLGPGARPAADILLDTADQFIPKGERISEEQFNANYAQLGLKWDPDMTQNAARIIAERRKRELRNQDIMARGNGSLGETVGKFGSALVASLLSPTNVALSFIPVVGEGKWAAWAAKYGKTQARLMRGAAEGIVGQAVAEPLALAARTDEQADYTMMNSLANVMVGAVMGAGLHTVGGKISDLLASGKEISAEFRSIDTAARQLADGRAVDIGALHMVNNAEVNAGRAAYAAEETGQAAPDIGGLREAEEQGVAQARDTVRSQENPQRSLDLDRQAFEEPPVVRNRMGENSLDAINKDIEESTEALYERLGKRELDDADKEFLGDADQKIAEAKAMAEGIKTAWDCILLGGE